ncbi:MULTISPECIES: hypothetical protein [unclassified Exiguobacterium]|uniref:hypothetical protein n=1 Tax=unclassified Exiguobacterium TaxID=2644629 RepID=UPI000B59788D|nr:MULTISPECIES: hypothetical protein [unclassified Exiguobacterium]ASI35448.1 hypothetical protein A0126_07700 [Exiguobacterium sp. N4-1P]ASI37461.1 hypothetical protein A0126_17980 [Exiguobacterium sp. N4-1P]
MKSFPEELDLLSLFSVKPDEPVPLFYYDESTYRFQNAVEQFIVRLTPASGQFSLQVNQRSDGRLLSSMSLQALSSFEIIQDDREAARILLTLEQDEVVQTIEIDVRPKFRLIFQEQLTR